MSDNPRDPDDAVDSPRAVDPDPSVVAEGQADPDRDDVEDLPTVSCARCGREWTLGYELDQLAVGNQAVEQFALDHQRHTGHFPDSVATHRAVCRRCPESVQRLSADAARRWAEVHARHTRHSVELRPAESDAEVALIGSPGGD